MKMLTSRSFQTFDETSAPAAARAGLAAARAQLGFVPAPIARYAASPTFLRIAQQALHAFEGTSLGGVEREVVAFAVIRRNQCGFCTAFHQSVTLPALKLDSAMVHAIVSGAALDDARLEALRRFTVGVLDHTGDVDEADFDRFLDSGFTREQALEVILGIGAYTMTTLANRLTQVEQD